MTKYHLFYHLSRNMSTFSPLVNPVIESYQYVIQQYLNQMQSAILFFLFIPLCFAKVLLSIRIVASIYLRIRCHPIAASNASSQVTLGITKQSLKFGSWRKGTIIHVLFSLSINHQMDDLLQKCQTQILLVTCNSQTSFLCFQALVT